MAQQSQPRFKSEVFVPIQKDSQSFEQRQRNIWDDMQERMERRRKEWEDEVEHMRRDFFRLKPQENRRGSSENLLERMDINDIFMDDSKEGNKTFRVSFDVSQFKADEISVRTQDNKLCVQAKHEEKSTGSNVSREFSRQVDIPKHVDPERLQCTLSNDGILQIEAPVPAPAYDRIRDNNLVHPPPPRAPQTHAQAHAHAHTHPTSHPPPPPQQSSSSLKTGPAYTEQDGSKKFKITVDIGLEFLPEDLMVKTIDKKLIVKARHEEKTAGRTSCKEFSREFDLPEHVDPNLVTAAMTDDGKLIVEAPISVYTKGSYTGRPGSRKEPTVTISFGK